MKREQDLVGHWAMFGHFNSSLGVAAAADALSKNLLNLGCSTTKVISGGTRSWSAPIGRTFDRPQAADFRRIISCVNPDQLGFVLAKFRLDPWQVNSHVGFWSWELPDVPKYFEVASRITDEVWTVSEFAGRALSSRLSVPVRVVRLPVAKQSFSSRQLEHTLQKFNLSKDDFIFLVTFDYFSDVERKNPIAAIRAYLDAFPHQGEARLIIKSMNSSGYPIKHNYLKMVANGRKDITFVDERIDQEEYDCLIAIANVTLSPHRAEGFGLNLQQAMANGRVVIGTGWSGNMDYMNVNNSIPLPYNLIEVTNYSGLKLKSTWAEPDHDFLVDAMRAVQASEALQNRIGKAAKNYMQDNYSQEACATSLLESFL